MNSAYLLLLAASCGIASAEIQLADFGHTISQPTVDEKPRAEKSEPGKSERAAEAKVAFRRMPIDQVQARLLQWLALAKVDEPTARQVSGLWKDKTELESLTAEETLDRIVDSLAIVDESARRIVEACRSGAPFSPPKNEFSPNAIYNRAPDSKSTA